MNTKTMNAQQYADSRGVSTAAVRRALIDGKKLIGVKNAEKVGRDWVLTVCTPVAKINKGKCVVTHA
jgi:hypothetical protein